LVKVKEAAAQVAAEMAFGYSPATSHATSCGMIATAILAMDIGEGMLVKPARGRMPAYCSAAHKKAGQRAEKKGA
jgi:hypothetical protein